MLRGETAWKADNSDLFGDDGTAARSRLASAETVRGVPGCIVASRGSDALTLSSKGLPRKLVLLGEPGLDIASRGSWSGSTVNSTARGPAAWSLLGFTSNALERAGETVADVAPLPMDICRFNGDGRRRRGFDFADLMESAGEREGEGSRRTTMTA